MGTRNDLVRGRVYTSNYACAFCGGTRYVYLAEHRERIVETADRALRNVPSFFCFQCLHCRSTRTMSTTEDTRRE